MCGWCSNKNNTGWLVQRVTLLDVCIYACMYAFIHACIYPPTSFERRACDSFIYAIGWFSRTMIGRCLSRASLNGPPAPPAKRTLPALLALPVLLAPLLAPAAALAHLAPLVPLAPLAPLDNRIGWCSLKSFV